jgi:hypothetical protein
MPSLDNAKRRAEGTVHQAGPWIEPLARLGYAAKGIVYIVIGVLAIEVAFHAGGKTPSPHGALAAIAHEPYGRFLLALTAVGLAGYALWRFVETFFDPENKGSDAKGLTTRLGYFISGAGYGALAYWAICIVTGAPHNSGGSTQTWTARLLSEPFGPWLVGLVGLIVIGIGVAQLVRSYTADVRRQMQLDELNPTLQKWVVDAGRFGYAARGVVFGIIGIFLIEAAVNSNPHKAIGLDGALAVLAKQAYGQFLLAVVAAGLIAYGLFQLVKARYRRIPI